MGFLLNFHWGKDGLVKDPWQIPLPLLTSCYLLACLCLPPYSGWNLSGLCVASSVLLPWFTLLLCSPDKSESVGAVLCGLGLRTTLQYDSHEQIFVLFVGSLVTVLTHSRWHHPSIPLNLNGWISRWIIFKEKIATHKFWKGQNSYLINRLSHYAL